MPPLDNTLMEFAHAVLDNIPSPDAYNAGAGDASVPDGWHCTPLSTRLVME